MSSDYEENFTKDKIIEAVLDLFETGLFSDKKIAESVLARDWRQTWRAKLAQHLSQNTGIYNIRRCHLNAQHEQCGGFTDVFLFFHEINNRERNEPAVRYVAIGCDRGTKTIRFTKGQTNRASMLIRGKDNPSLDVFRAFERYDHAIDYGEMYKETKIMADFLGNRFKDALPSFFDTRFPGKENRKLINKIMPLLKQAVSDVLLDHRKTVIAQILSEDGAFINVPLWQACREIQNKRDNREFLKQYEPKRLLYNTLARYKREGQSEIIIQQLPLMVKISQIFADTLLEEEIWDEIASGESPYVAVGKYFGVSKSTIKECTRRYDIHSYPSNCDWKWKEILPVLDVLHPNKWPVLNADQCLKDAWLKRSSGLNDGRCFATCFKAAKIYAKYFYHTENRAAEILKHWVKQHCKASGGSWYGMMKIIFHEEWEISHNEHGNQTDNLVKSYKTNLNNINDLKHDVKKKILEPLVERALQSVSNSVSHAIREKAVEVLNTKLWAMALPNEQRSASHYWHAPNARMAQKYNVLIGKEKVEWGALMPQAVTDLPHGFSVHCLNSEALLLEETLEMDHCVWSYVDKCIGNNYHIFSIRDKDGKHATTLTLHAIPYAEGEEPFKIFHHLGYKNRHAAGSEQEAAQELLRRLNKGEIKPDWDKMERQRKQAREAWEAKKMDPMDDAMFQRVLDLYKPCLPKALRKCEFTADGLIKTLGIHNIFEEVLQQDRSVARKMSTYISTQPHQAAGPL